ncbi:MAG TPA: MlaD family protein [Solirubrobacterales bacterium]|jgi:ABC-type transporter Mla subunit MlaD|nr:MlaD family protein [Solirubrobacterales bacterium]
MADPRPKPKDYDERIYRKGHPPHRIRNALILIGLVLIGTYLAVTKELPFGDDYEVKAVFENAANIRKDSPVRIAGVNVGEVKSVRSVGDAAEVTFTVSEDGRPLREDTLVEIRPRIFLEGNFFLDVKPGSPSASEIPDGGTVPITQTATAVQLDQILTTLQAPDRENLSKLLRGYGGALNDEPTAADDEGEDPDIQGETAAEAINDSFKYGGDAGRDSAIVNQALLGTEAGDLSGLIAANARVFGALGDREQQLQDLVTNFNTFSGALAAESDNLAETVRLLAPTLENATPSLRNTNATFPYLRAFARDIEPGIRELPATINASGPWLRQTRLLLDQSELGRLANQLRLTAPPAGELAAATPGLFSEQELLSRCVSDVLIPTGDIPITDVFTPGNNVPNYKEFGYALTGFAGEMQNFDANGAYLRFQTGGGDWGGNNGLVQADVPGAGLPTDTVAYGRAQAEPIATQPLLGAKPTYNDSVACHTNPVPDLDGPVAGPGPASPRGVP